MRRKTSTPWRKAALQAAHGHGRGRKPSPRRQAAWPSALAPSDAFQTKHGDLWAQPTANTSLRHFRKWGRQTRPLETEADPGRAGCTPHAAGAGARSSQLAGGDC